VYGKKWMVDYNVEVIGGADELNEEATIIAG
jgi:hypothetical protein